MMVAGGLEGAGRPIRWRLGLRWQVGRDTAFPPDGDLVTKACCPSESAVVAPCSAGAVQNADRHGRTPPPIITTQPTSVLTAVRVSAPFRGVTNPLP